MAKRPTDEERAAFKRQELEAAKAIMAGDRYCPDPSAHVARAQEQAAPAVTVDDLARVYEDGMRAGIIAGRAGQEFDDALAEVNRLVDSADTNATADAIRALARLSESVPSEEPQ